MKAGLVAFIAGSLVVGCSDVTAPRFKDLPESVQSKINAQADAGQTVRIEKEHDAGRVIYHIEFHEKGKVVKLAVTENGTVISDSRSKVINEAAGAPLNFGRVSAQRKFGQLPPAVQKTVGSTSDKLEIVNVDEVKRGGRRVFEIEFGSPGSNPKLYIAEDGSVIDDERSVFRH